MTYIEYLVKTCVTLKSRTFCLSLFTSNTYRQYYSKAIMWLC